jgi:hypothetical protein
MPPPSRSNGLGLGLGLGLGVEGEDFNVTIVTLLSGFSTFSSAFSSRVILFIRHLSHCIFPLYP